MKVTDAPSHISGVSLSKVELLVGGAGDMSMTVAANLISNKGDVHGNTKRVGGWSPEVMKAVAELTKVLESHLLAVNFDVGEQDDRAAEHITPTGILTP